MAKEVLAGGQEVLGIRGTHRHLQTSAWFGPAHAEVIRNRLAPGVTGGEKQMIKNIIKRNLPARPDASDDAVDRRGFLKCMGWAGTGLLWTLDAGIPSSNLLAAPAKAGSFSFVQISDSHIGFNRAANPDVTATMQEAIGKINALPAQPDFIIHTGDLTHQSKPKEFDDMDSVCMANS